MAISKRLLTKIRKNQYRKETLTFSEPEPDLTERDIINLTDALKSNTHVKKLELRYCNVTDSWLKVLSSVKTIESLDVFGNLITDAGLVYLLDMPLKKLQIGGNDTIKSLDVLCRHQSLEVLIASHCKNLDSMEGFISEAKVRVLGLSFCGIEDDELKRVAENGSLEELFLAGDFLTAEGIGYIAKSATIKVLDVSKTNLDNKGAIILSRMSSLQKLNIHGTFVGDAGVMALAKNIKINVLDASSLHLTLESCKALSENENLTELDISSAQLEDSEISLLARMANLKKLLAVYNPITEASIDILAKSQIETIDVSSLKKDDARQTLFFGFNANGERIREVNVDYDKTSLSVKPSFQCSPLYRL